MRSAAPVSIPRWEWRTFAPFDDARLRGQLGAPVTSGARFREITVLCARSMHDVLIRGEVLRLKWRKQVGSNGLELWDRVLCATFPCPSEDVLRLFEAWVLPAPELNRTSYSKAQFLEEILPQHPELKPVDIARRSETYLFDGISCELTTLTADQLQLESFCIEHEDPGLVLQAIHRLGLEGWRNTSYPQGLKTALNLPIQH